MAKGNGAKAVVAELIQRRLNNVWAQFERDRRSFVPYSEAELALRQIETEIDELRDKWLAELGADEKPSAKTVAVFMPVDD